MAFGFNLSKKLNEGGQNLVEESALAFDIFYCFPYMFF